MRLACIPRLSLVALLSLLLRCSEPPAVAPPPAAPTPAPPPAELAAPAAPAPPATVQLGGSCDELSSAYLKECQDNPAACAETSKSSATLSYRTILNDGAFLSSCKSPPSTGVKLCVAIREGHAIGVTVTTTPGDEHLSTCIGKAIQGIAFPASPRLDVASTTFAAQ